MRSRYWKLLPGLLILCHAALRGQGRLSDTLIPLEEVQVISDRFGLTEARSGRHVTVIRSDGILALPVNSVDELLRYLPFAEIQSRGPFGTQSDILIRGSTFNQVLVLIDGMRVNDPLTGHFNSNIPVPLVDIERIEVYRGPASAVYGPDAVGGVVNIVTRSFESVIQDTDGIDGTLEMWYGQHKLKRSNSGLSFGKSGWRVAAGVSYNASDGHPLDPDSLRGDFNIITPSLSVAGKPTENIDFSFRTAYDRRLFNARYFYTNSSMDLSREEVRKWWNQMQLRFRLSDAHSMTLAAAYQSTRDSFLFNPAFQANIHRTGYLNIQVNHLFLAGNEFRLASGLQADRRKITSKDRGNHLHRHAGAYVMMYRVLGNLSLSGGARLDLDPLYRVEILPQVNLSYNAGKWNFRASGGRSVRSPDFTERYVSTGLDGPLSPGRNLGNPDLTAERAWSIEGGVDRRLGGEIQFRITGFHRFSRDLIDYVFTEAEDIPDNGNLVPGGSYFYARNIGLLNTTGLETELYGKHRMGQGWILDWGISHQLLGSRSDSAVVSKYLSAHALNLVQARLGIRSGGFSIRITSMYKNRNEETAQEINRNLSKAYMVWNVRLDQYLWENRFQLGLQVNNVMNRDYSDILGARMPGRWILGGITWNFNTVSFTNP